MLLSASGTPVLWRGALPRSGGTYIMGLAWYLLERHGITTREVTPLVAEATEQAWPPEIALAQLARALFQDAGAPPVMGSGGYDGFYFPLIRHPLFRVLMVRRDPRESLVSYMTLTRASFEDVSDLLPIWLAAYDGFAALPAAQCLCFDFRRDLADVTGCLQRIGTFLDLPVTPALAREADSLFRYDVLRTTLQTVQEAAVLALRAIDAQGGAEGVLLPLTLEGARVEEIYIPLTRLTPESRETVQGGTGRVRVTVLADEGPVVLTGNMGGGSLRILSFEHEKLPPHLKWFNLEHVAGGRRAWREVLTPSQQAHLARLGGDFFRRHGFDPA